MSSAPRFPMVPAVILLVAMTVAGCASDSTTPTPGNDPPAITFLEPGYAVEGDPPFLLYVHGEGFNLNSVVRWDGADRITTLQNPAPGEFVLRASISANDVANPDTVAITVFNPVPGGGLSNAVDFQVYDPADLNPVPTISTVNPSTVTHNTQVTITVHGTGFANGARVLWTPVTTSGYTENNVTVVSANELTVVIPANHVNPLGVATLEVVNPAPGGGTSNPETVTVF